MRPKLTIEKMVKIAKERDGQCLSEKYINNCTKLKWQCKEGHIWEATPANISSLKQWCPTCGRKRTAEAKKLGIKKMHSLARQHGGKCLSKKYADINTKLKWQCQEGHIWESRPANIMAGNWCQTCGIHHRANLRKLGIKKMHILAKQHGGKCLSKKYTDINTKLKWQCKEGHIWESRPANITTGNWCPACGANDRAKPKRLGIEKMHALAKQRGGRCLSNEYINIYEKLKWQCKEGHVWKARPDNISHGNWCPICGTERAAKMLRHPIEKMHSLALRYEGKCLSEEYINFATKLKWQCKEGHIWESTPSNVSRGNWCPTCRHQSFDYWNILYLAKCKQGHCFADSYQGKFHKYHWKCERGHEWRSAFHKAKALWCPECDNKAQQALRVAS